MHECLDILKDGTSDDGHPIKACLFLHYEQQVCRNTEYYPHETPLEKILHTPLHWHNHVGPVILRTPHPNRMNLLAACHHTNNNTVIRTFKEKLLAMPRKQRVSLLGHNLKTIHEVTK
jgi:hypothetical protein